MVSLLARLGRAQHVGQHFPLVELPMVELAHDLPLCTRIASAPIPAALTAPPVGVYNGHIVISKHKIWQ
jgi:hypothetical protein